MKPASGLSFAAASAPAGCWTGASSRSLSERVAAKVFASSKACELDADATAAALLVCSLVCSRSDDADQNKGPYTKIIISICHSSEVDRQKRMHSERSSA